MALPSADAEGVTRTLEHAKEGVIRREHVAATSIKSLNELIFLIVTLK